MGSTPTPPSGTSGTYTGRATQTRLAPEALAHRLLEATQLPAFSDPRFHALRLGCALAFGNEPTTAGLLVYPHHPDPRELGWRIHLALAESWLLRISEAFSPADVVNVALSIALPLPCMVGQCPTTILVEQRFVPAQVIRHRFSMLGAM